MWLGMLRKSCGFHERFHDFLQVRLLLMLEVMPQQRRLPLATEWAHQVLAGKIRAGAWVVDATAGNGHDTLFLARQVGSTGHVFVFDVQEEALQETRRRLVDSKIQEDSFTLIMESHSLIKETLPREALGRIEAVVFNLGFLPGGDKRMSTQCASTVAALTSASTLLAPGGVLTVVAYPGHAAGKDEAEAVSHWMSALAPERFEVQNIRAVNRMQPAPELWLALRLRIG